MASKSDGPRSGESSGARQTDPPVNFPIARGRETEEELRRTNAALTRRVADLQTANEKVRDAQRAALNLMEDAVQSQQAMERVTVELGGSEERLRKELASTQQLQSVSALLIEGGNTDAIYQKIVDAAVVIMQSDMASLQRVDEGEDALQLLAWQGCDATFGETFKLSRPDAKTSCSVARRMGHRVIVPDVETCDFITGTAALEDHRKTGIRAVQSTPLFSRDGGLLGMISTHWCTPHVPAESDLRQFDILVRQAADLIERKQTEERLKQFTAELEQRVSGRTKELVQSEDRLRMLATELNLAEQRERKRLATELHDYLAQLLVLGRMALGQAKRTGLSPRAEDFVKETEDILGKALTYCRTLMAELSPPVLQEQGLSAGLRWLANHMQRQELTVTFDMEQSGDVPLPEDRAVLLFQSVRELLINVAKHGVVKKANVRMTEEDGLLRIVVRDENGFDPAAAVGAAYDNSSPLSSKFGLLSIRERMRALGGIFDLQSAPGKGTTATLTLPVAEWEKRDKRDEQEFTARPVSPLSPVSRAPHSAPIRVLLVDDHTLLREGLRSIVMAHKHLVVVGEAGDGAEAIELVRQLDPDVVLMDINMPKMDGIEATKRIKTDRPKTVVIGLSVIQSVETDQKMRQAGAAAYLTKESAADALCHAIESAVSYKPGTAAQQIY